MKLLYSFLQPKDRAHHSPGTFVPLEKELVFDLDMSDYNPIRKCCTGVDVCSSCWFLMSVAIEVIDDTLRRDFGFKHLLWVYSGRRGVHCWVTDTRARCLDFNARCAIAHYINVFQRDGIANLSAPLHPSLRAAYEDVLLPSFEQSVIPGMRILKEKDSRMNVLQLIKHAPTALAIEKAWDTEESSCAQKWATLKALVNAAILKREIRNRNPIWDIVFTYCYPRLDMPVTTDLTHLLKAPFCAHPSTGKICVPIDPLHCREFNPLTVPTIYSLMGDIDRFDETHGRLCALSDWKKTTLRDHIIAFKSMAPPPFVPLF